MGDGVSMDGDQNGALNGLINNSDTFIIER